VGSQVTFSACIWCILPATNFPSPMKESGVKRGGGVLVRTLFKEHGFGPSWESIIGGSHEWGGRGVCTWWWGGREG